MKLENKMKKIFKTTLVAASIAAMSSVANAGTLATTTVNYSAQGAAAAAATATTAVTFNHTVNAGFAVNDLITYALPAGSFDKTGTNWQSTINFAAGSGGASMVATLLSTNADETEATYRVTNVTATTSQTTIGAMATGISATLLNSQLGGDVSVSVSSVLANGVTPIDAGTKAAKLVDSKDQLGDIKVASNADFDATISVAADRKAFTAGTADTVTWTATNDTTLTDAVTVTKTVVTLNGDFAGMASANFSSANGTAAYVDADKAVTVTYTGVVTTDTITVTPPTGTKAIVLNDQSFTVAGVSSYGTSTESLGSANAGAWDLDGAVVNVPYMPYGANIGQIIYVTNKGSLDGDVTVTAFDEAGNTYDLGVVGMSKAGQVTKLTLAISEALAAQGFTAGKLAMTITVNAQDKDVTVHAAYNVGGSDRGSVFTSQYKN
jgi:hypothetical protein